MAGGDRRHGRRPGGGVRPPRRDPELFYIRGGGDGHGVGMSQYGAYGYALHGEDYRFILAHYYRGTTLGTAAPGSIVRVLLASGNGNGASAFSGATVALGRVRRRRLGCRPA